jgi:hypothetical protein
MWHVIIGGYKLLVLCQGHSFKTLVMTRAGKTGHPTRPVYDPRPV